jgi:hypothetical protein
MRQLLTAVLGGVCFAAVSAQADVRFNEFAADLPGTDNGSEFIELRSDTPSFSMSGLTLVVIEGDGANAGLIDVALDLNSFSTGANGLFLWRDAATVLQPPPEAATVLNVADFNPDIENGSNTFLIVAGFSGVVGSTDVDTDNDGTLDATAWTSVMDAIGITENDGAANVVYADDVGGVAFPANALFNPDAFQRFGAAAWAFDILGVSPGPFTSDPVEIMDSTGAPVVGSPFSMTPGSANVPEPASLALLVLAGTLAARSRR